MKKKLEKHSKVKMEKEKYIKKLNRLLSILDDLGKAEDFDQFLEDNDIDLQEIIWACTDYLTNYKKQLEKEV